MFKEELKVEDGVLFVHLSGKLPEGVLQSPKNAFAGFAQSCAKRDCAKAIIDARELQVDLRTQEMFKAGRDIATVTPRPLRVAFLAGEDMLDKFFEETAKRHGATIRVFTDPDEARERIAKDPE